MVARSELDDYLSQLLATDRFKDYGPNGLQVEGRPEVARLMSGVTASRDLIDEAVAWEADALLVHHGLFWRGQDGRIVGWMKERLARLLKHDISLYAYHLPLDAHAELGNNAQWAQLLGWRADAWCGDQDLVQLGATGELQTLPQLAMAVGQALGREPTVVRGDGRLLRRAAWCSGGAQGYFEAAIAAGADVFLTGEISEPQAHLARETGVAFLACGHHATERGGARAVGEHVASRFGLAHRFVDLPNPA